MGLLTTFRAKCLDMLLLLLLVVCGAAAPASVIKVSQRNAYVLATKTIFVKFFAPWCRYCKEMAADWERLAREAKGFEVGQVDCTEEDSKALCDKWGVDGFPTLLFFRDFKAYKYNRARTFEVGRLFCLQIVLPDVGRRRIIATLWSSRIGHRKCLRPDDRKWSAFFPSKKCAMEGVA